MGLLEQNVSPEKLAELMRYDAQTGKLYWLPRECRHFNDGYFQARDLARRWNTRYAGLEALTAVAKNGYLMGTVCDYTAMAHRCCWAVAMGHWPVGEIDHINGVRGDNRLSNLRDVSRQENRKNSGIRANTSGVLGVSWNAQHKMWVAQITINGRNTYLGRFLTIADAAIVRKQASIRNGFHENHGDRRRQA